MPFNALSGLAAHVEISDIPYCFQKFTVSMKVKLGSVNTFCGGGFETYVGGMKGCKIVLEGLYDEGNMAFSLGGNVECKLFFTALISLDVFAIVETIDNEADVDATSDPVGGDRHASKRGSDHDRNAPKDRLNGKSCCTSPRRKSPTTAKSVGLAMLDHAMAKTSPTNTNGQDGAAQ